MTLTLKIYKPIFLHDIPADDDASPYQLWLQNVWCFSGSEDIISTKIDILNFAVTLTLNTAIQFFSKAYDDVPQTKYGCKGISSSEDTVETAIFCLCKPSL